VFHIVFYIASYIVSYTVFHIEFYIVCYIVSHTWCYQPVTTDLSINQRVDFMGLSGPEEVEAIMGWLR